ncbi:iron-containing alcohol dehydrogenase [Pseudodesulfovibrio tunisiensis]|uniref:iron-containing alcohol dehydrogenase n=1 Tax=Pseudodesulfovibrio tunisiensis TaxID=463192 RepID=UPI001FB3C4B9|nr:iron-containing alcohol dehydrogenase [Pseudodesulfovibrio tunisiensis]
MHFSFATSSRILFGPGAASDLPEQAAELGQRACLVTGSKPERHQALIKKLRSTIEIPLTIPVAEEPNTDSLIKAARQAKAESNDMVIAVGGGSVLDTGKALAALLTNPGDLFDYLEVVGKGLPLTSRPAPCIAVPTTSGTGAEVTANAVLLSPRHQVKVSLRSPAMIPDIVLVDPELTLDVPPSVTAATGMDALTQLLEAFVTHAATPLTDGLCREGLVRAGRSLKQAFDHGDDIAAREDMAVASLFSGMALANAKLGAAHGFAAPLGGEFHAPHGAICAALLPGVMAVNIRALRERMPNSPALARYAEVARILTNTADATPEDGIARIKQLCLHMNIPGLSAMGVTEKDFPNLAEKAGNASSMKGNPIELTRDELLEILQLGD